MNENKATVKIQDGCSQQCSYCLVRKLRGKSVCFSYDTISEDIKLFSEIKKTNHICICGVNTIEYNHESIGNIIDLMKQLFVDFPDMIFELDNINPFDEVKLIELIELMKHNNHIYNKVCVSIQSASDKLLASMH